MSENKEILQEGKFSDWLQNSEAQENIYIHGLSEDPDKKIVGLVVPLGYKQRKMEHPGFIDSFKIIRNKTLNAFPDEYFDLGLYQGTIPQFQIKRDKEFLVFDAEEIYNFKKQVSAQHNVEIDMVHFLVEPRFLNSFHKKSMNLFNDFGYADEICSVTAGPLMSNKGYVYLYYPRALAHEQMHLFSSTAVQDPVYINDFYNVELEKEQVEKLKNNCLSEYFLQDPTNPGKPMPSASLAITKTIEDYKKTFGRDIEWHDTGQAFHDNGIDYRIISPNGKGEHIMVEENNQPSDFLKLLVDNLAKSYLVNCGRMENEELKKELSENLESKFNMVNNIKSAYEGFIKSSQKFLNVDLPKTFHAGTLNLFR